MDIIDQLKRPFPQFHVQRPYYVAHISQAWRWRAVQWIPTYGRRQWRNLALRSLFNRRVRYPRTCSISLPISNIISTEEAIASRRRCDVTILVSRCFAESFWAWSIRNTRRLPVSSLKTANSTFVHIKMFSYSFIFFLVDNIPIATLHSFNVMPGRLHMIW